MQVTYDACIFVLEKGGSGSRPSINFNLFYYV